MGLTKTQSGGLEDQSVSLDKLPHGTSSNDGKFLRANNGADPSFETVNTDLVSDTSPQLGGTLLTAGHNIILTDTTGANNNRLVFGANTDMSIYHLPNNNYIDADTGTLHIRHSGETGAKFIKNGAVELYFDNVKKFETQSSGINVQGVNSYDAQIKIHGQPTIGRSYWGYGNNQSYTGTLVGRTDSSVASTIFMGVDVTGNGGGLFGGLGSEIVFRRDHIFTTPNAANNNFVTCMRFGRATSTEGAVAFTNGLMFGTDQADANIIDDYEEGTFTPVMKFGGSNTGMSVGSMAGIYTKIGRMVYGTLRFTMTGKGSSTGQLAFHDLPFAVGDALSTTSVQGGFALQYLQGGIGSIHEVMAYPWEGTSEMRVYKRVNNNDATATFTDSDISSTFDGRISFFYTT